MLMTNHFKERMSQRGLPKKLIDIVLELGKEKGDKLILDKKNTQKLITEIDGLKKDLLKIMDKGGVAIVLDNESLITTYNISKKRK